MLCTSVNILFFSPEPLVSLRWNQVDNKNFLKVSVKPYCLVTKCWGLLGLCSPEGFSYWNWDLDFSACEMFYLQETEQEMVHNAENMGKLSKYKMQCKSHWKLWFVAFQQQQQQRSPPPTLTYFIIPASSPRYTVVVLCLFRTCLQRIVDLNLRKVIIVHFKNLGGLTLCIRVGVCVRFYTSDVILAVCVWDLLPLPSVLFVLSITQCVSIMVCCRFSCVTIIDLPNAASVRVCVCVVQ